MSKRKHRVEITVVTPSGTMEYRHAQGDLKSDGTPTDGPDDREFAIAQKAVLEILNVMSPTKEETPHPEKLERIFRLVNRWCTRPESVLREGAMVLANDAEMWKKLRELVRS